MSQFVELLDPIDLFNIFQLVAADQYLQISEIGAAALAAARSIAGRQAVAAVLPLRPAFLVKRNRGRLIKTVHIFDNFLTDDAKRCVGATHPLMLISRISDADPGRVSELGDNPGVRSGAAEFVLVLRRFFPASQHDLQRLDQAEGCGVLSVAAAVAAEGPAQLYHIRPFLPPATFNLRTANAD